MRHFLFLIMMVWAAGTANAACTDESFNSQKFTLCRFDPATTNLRLFNFEDNGQPLLNFNALESHLKAEGKTLTFAMNAGMFDENHRAIGLYVEAGKTLHKASRSHGPGNFNLKPNGVFYWGKGKAGVMETDAYLKSGIRPDYATQSGPLLVINGRIHPKISPSGTSAKFRNGVGIDKNGQIIFAISAWPVTFYSFASLFKDGLNCPNALFLDGSISSLYAPELSRNDNLSQLGPMVGAFEQN